jgi:hypothetical protein
MAEAMLPVGVLPTGTPDATIPAVGRAPSLQGDTTVRVTGLVLALIGLLAGVICVVVLVQPSDPNQQAPINNTDQVQRPNVVLPLALCGVAIVVGGAMYMYGSGRSYNVSNDPRVRN